ncbi:RNA-binding protein cabeza-like protein [Colletotrichum higginsianum]|nr:RNA-binding protein cabeza-like protein [Colletotrichum higginsianum]
MGSAPPGTVNPMDLQIDSNSPIFADESQRNKSVAHRWLTEKGHILPLISRTPSGDVQVQPNDLQCSGQNQQASFGPMPYGNMIPNNQFSYNYNYEGMGMNETGRASGSHINSARNDPPLDGPTFSTSNERE